MSVFALAVDLHNAVTAIFAVVFLTSHGWRRLDSEDNKPNHSHDILTIYQCSALIWSQMSVGTHQFRFSLEYIWDLRVLRAHSRWLQAPLPCRGISSPTGHWVVRCGSSGWSAGAGSACRTGTGRKWAGCTTHPLPETSGPECKSLAEKYIELERFEKTNNKWKHNGSEDHIEFLRLSYRTQKDLRCVPPWSSRSLTDWWR